MKKKFFLLSFSFLLLISVAAQTELSRTDFDLGEISLLNADIVDFSIRNISEEDVFILRIEAEQEVGIQYTSRTIRQGKTEDIRIKLNPARKGKIERKVQLYLGSEPEPIELIIRANVKAIPKNNRQACPQFGSALKPPSGRIQPVAEIKEFPLALYDESRGEQLASLREYEAEENITKQETTEENQDDVISRKTVRSQPVRTKKVRKTPEERRNGPSLGQILFGKPEVEIKTDTTTELTTIEAPLSIEEPIEEETTNPSLLDNSFKPNNIVFLIDASTSMREENKMDILKRSMVQLLEPLREQDYLSIVTYSGDAKVILEPTSGMKKEEIKASIENIKADGSTQAVKGIKKAISVGKSNFIEGGNNQIILATDGAFDIGSKNKSLRKKIENTANNGLVLTILGIKNDTWTNKSLKELVKLGKGDLIKIKSERDASKVLEEVKRKSLY